MELELPETSFTGKTCLERAKVLYNRLSQLSFFKVPHECELLFLRYLTSS